MSNEDVHSLGIDMYGIMYANFILYFYSVGDIKWFSQKVLRKWWRTDCKYVSTGKNAGPLRASARTESRGAAHCPLSRNLGRFAFSALLFFSIALFRDLPAESLRHAQRGNGSHRGTARITDKRKWFHGDTTLKVGWKWVRKHYDEEAAIMRQFTLCVERKNTFF